MFYLKSSRLSLRVAGFALAPACLLFTSLTGNAQNLPTEKAKPTPPPVQTPAPPGAPTNTGELLKEQLLLETIAQTADDDDRIAKLQAFLKDRPKTPLAHSCRLAIARSYLQRGERALRTGKIDAATESFNKAIATVPDPDSVANFRSFILPLPVRMATAGFRAEGIQFMRRQQERYWDRVEALEQIGVFYISVEDPQDAIKVLTRANELDAKQSNLHYNLGVALQIGLRLDDAATEFQMATQLDPKSRVAWGALADVYRANGSYEEAEKYYREQLAVDSEHPTAWGGLALTFIARNREADALEPMARMLNNNPRDVRFFTQMAYLYATQDQITSTTEMLARARQLQPNYPWIRILEAHLLRKAGDITEAENVLGEAQNTAKFPTLLFELGKTMVLANDFDKAIEPFEEFLKITPDGEFEAILGGALESRTPKLARLIAPERNASLLINASLTTDEEYQIVERYARFALLSKLAIENKSSTRASSTALETAADEFAAGEDKVRGLRALYIANRLVEAEQFTLAERFTRRAIDAAGDVAKSATQADDGMTEEERLGDFYVRAQSTLGWILFKQGETAAAAVRLREAANAYPNVPARKEASWKLGVVLEAGGSLSEAFDAYKAGYDKSLATASIRRSVLEAVYKKVHGSLDGFEDAIAQ